MSDIKLFESVQIRSVWNEADAKWYFSVADVVQALTDSVNVRDYIKKMRKREQELDANWGTLCPPLELLAPGDEWIEKRVRGIAIRDELTHEWQKRGVKEQREYARRGAQAAEDEGRVS